MIEVEVHFPAYSVKFMYDEPLDAFLRNMRDADAMGFVEFFDASGVFRMLDVSKIDGPTAREVTNP